MYEHIKTFDEYFETRETLDRDFWKASEELSDVYDRLMEEADSRDLQSP